jgi:CBS domain-containing protein
MTYANNTIGGIIGERAPIGLTPQHTVREAATVLSSHAIGAAPVLDGDRLVGMFTERDVLQRVVAAGRDVNATTVGEVMTPEPCTITMETPLVKAFAIMIEGKFRHLPVVGDSGRVVAILSMRDIPPEHRIMHQQWTEWQNGKPATVTA